MSTTGSAQFARNSEPIIKVKVKRTHRKLITFLLSSCIFLAVFSGCLLTALVLIGKHYIHNVEEPIIKSTTTAKPADLRNYQTKQPEHNASQPADDDHHNNNTEVLYRLSRDVIPSHYTLLLKPNLKTGILKGKVNITVHISSVQSEIVLHAYQLNFTKVVINTVGDVMQRMQIKQLVVNEGAQVLIIDLKSSIQPGDYYIGISYQVDISKKRIGMYMSHYNNKLGQKRAMATSKFEPTYARQAFPCFDEPNMKAKFQVNLLKPADDPAYKALSNMPVDSDERTAEGIVVRFKESVKMSTYLACFIVSDFNFTEDTIALSEGKTIPFRVYATPDQISKTEYARGVGKKVIEFYNDYFGIDFPLPKLDMAAIPDFVSGAMEHWGLVTYRETALLYSEEISATVNKQRVATVVAHELAHSWFGNLVTMNWWNDLWLNEGFASYIEYKGVEHAENYTWKMMDQFLPADLHPVLKLDAALSSHPIVQTVITPDQITSIFDTISYNKGAAILRMLEDAVTEDVFKDGVTAYLKKHEYSNAVTQDLWHELENLTDVVDVSEFMNTWTVQMGYPVVTVKEDGDNYILTQKRYLTDQDAVDNTETQYNYTWMIPVSYITNDTATSTLFWFPHTSPQIAIPKPAEAKWVKFNYKQVGYYRVVYEDVAHWKALIANIGDMETSDRAHLIEETFRLAESGHIPYTVPFELTDYLRNELEYVPWSVVATVVSELKTFLLSSEQFTKFRHYITDIIKNAYDHYTWTESASDDHLTKRARVQILSLACAFGHSECLKIASERFVKWLESDTEVLSQDLRSLIYNYGMANSPPEYWEMLFDRFVNESDAGEKLRLLNGLTSVKDTSYLIKLIEMAKTDEYVRSQDYFTCLQYISSNSVGTSIVWDYFREHWPELVERFTLNDRYLGQLIVSITSTFATTTKLEEIKAFDAKYPEAGAGAGSRLKAIETVENNIKWLAKYKEQVESWLDSNVHL